MASFVKPKVFLIGETALDIEGLKDYLEYSNRVDFYKEVVEAKKKGYSDGEIVCSIYAKLCYKSLVVGENDNIEEVRSIPDNIAGIIKTSHLSVIENAYINFIVYDCSRVYTHEQVRHRTGFGYAQTSGRYCRGNDLKIVFDDILYPIEEECMDLTRYIEDWYIRMVTRLGLDEMEKKDFAIKKRLTSALRRFLPNGQANEIGISVNLRALRHTILLRTSRHAESEIRDVYSQMYQLVKQKYPGIFADAKEAIIDQILEVSGMKMQPYEISVDDPNSLRFWSTESLQAELDKRGVE